jgi:hypothetical protein
VKAAPAVVLLGPQRADVDVGLVLRDLGVRRIALVTAGWQEREKDDAPLLGELAALGIEAVNLKLHARSHEVFDRDLELKAAYQARQELLRHLQGFYRIRLEKTDDAARAIAVRLVEPDLLQQELKVSVDQFRQLDQDHMERCRAIHADFEARWRVGEREVVARHREELRALIEPTDALVIAGGHVASLLNRMKLFDVVHLAAGKPIVAWSAGAMVLTDRIILFHDFPPYGSDIAQVLDAGFGAAPGLVVLPDPRRRIQMDNRAGIGRFAQRMAPATCLAMAHGARVVLEGGRVVRASAERLTPAGDVERGWAG